MGEVVKLPTAAPRRVRNDRYSAQIRAAGQKFREAEMPETWLSPSQRTRAKMDRMIQNVPRSPELALVLCLLDTLPAEQLLKMAGNAEKMLRADPDDWNAGYAVALLSKLAGSKRNALWRDA